jgi:serine/threonine protein kinase
MWSCGVVLYYMLTGEPTFGMRAVDNPRRHIPGQDPLVWEDCSYDAHMQQIQTGPKLHHAMFHTEPHGPDLRQLLKALLEFNPHHRPSIEQLRSAQYFPWFAEGLPAAHNPSGQEQGAQALRPVRFERVKSALTSVVEDARKILMNQAAQPDGMMMVP